MSILIFGIRKWWAHRSRRIDERLLFPAFDKAVRNRSGSEIPPDEAYEWMVESHKRDDPAWNRKYD